MAMTMTTSFLDDLQVERLGELLDLRAVPFMGFNLEALDGYLSAIAVSPELIATGEWQAPIWGSKAPAWNSAEEALEAQSLLLGHWNACQARANYDGDDLPEHLSPLLWLPEDPDAEQPAELDVGRDWAHGFFAAVELRSEAWQRWLDDSDWIDEIFALLEQLATGEVAPIEPADAVARISFRERMEIVASLPGMLADLNQHRLEQPSPLPARPRRTRDA